MLTAFDVAHHWPHVKSHVQLHRRKRVLEVLDRLALAQFQSGGEAVTLSRHLRTGERWSEGELGRARVVLRELEADGIVARRDGAGRRGHAWTFAPDLAHRWRVGWRWSGRAVETAIEGCACRADPCLVARFPGQSGALSRDKAVFWLGPRAHLGIYPPAARDYGAERATTGQAPERFPTTARDYGAPIVAASQLPGSVFDTSLLHEEEEGLETAQGRAVAHAITELTGSPLYPGSKPRQRLMVAMGASSLDPAPVISELRRIPSPTFMLCVARVEELARTGIPERPSTATRIPGVDGLRAAGYFEEADQLEREMTAHG
jgi:hypothetical protein